MILSIICLTILMLTVCSVTAVVGQSAAEEINYDEGKVPAYTLPDPLVTQNGKKVTDARMWKARRRLGILHLFETQVYGKTPAKAAAMRFHVNEIEPKA